MSSFATTKHASSRPFASSGTTLVFSQIAHSKRLVHQKLLAFFKRLIPEPEALLQSVRTIKNKQAYDGARLFDTCVAALGIAPGTGCLSGLFR